MCAPHRWGPHPIFLLFEKQWQHIIDPHWMSIGKVKNYLPSICGSGWLLALEREKPSYIATLTHTSAPGLPCGLKSLSFEQNFGLKHCIPKKHTHATESRITGKRGGEGDLCLGFIQHLIDSNTKVSKHPWSDTVRWDLGHHGSRTRDAAKVSPRESMTVLKMYFFGLQNFVVILSRS